MTTIIKICLAVFIFMLLQENVNINLLIYLWFYNCINFLTVPIVYVTVKLLLLNLNNIFTLIYTSINYVNTSKLLH